jgi:hypothetical protein
MSRRAPAASPATHEDAPHVTTAPAFAWTAPPGAPRRVTDGLATLDGFPVEPHQFYRLILTARLDAPAYWVLDFEDAAGNLLRADNYSALDPAPAGEPQTFMVLARHLAARARLGIRPISLPVDLCAARIEPVGKPDVLAWMDRLYATLPPVHLQPPPARWERLGATLAALRAGRPLRLVMLGDSVANDLANGHPQLLIERAWPGAEITFIHSMEKEKAPPGYQHDNLVEPYVIRYRPDLLVIAGMSFGGDDAAVVNVVRQVRARLPAVDVLVVNASLTERGNNRSADVAPFLARLEAAGAAERFAVLDLRRPWEEYVAASPHPDNWYKRDVHHAAERGKQVLARLFAAFFVPPETPPPHHP